MSRGHAWVAPGRARTRVRRDRPPSRGRGSRAAARDVAQSERAHTGAGPTGTTAHLAQAALSLLAVTLLLAAVLHVRGVGPRAGHSSGSRRAASSAIDPRLILLPHTVTQAATAAGVRVELTAAPLLPGPNRFELRLAERGRSLAGARVLLVARMIGMAMRPVMVPMREVQPGRYAAMGPLAMFGRWQVTVQTDRPGAASFRHQFTVSVDLPSGPLAASATRGAPQQ